MESKNDIKPIINKLIQIKKINGNQYIGSLVDNKPHGKGKMNLSDGSVYEGQWERGSKIKGKMTFANGAVYEGDWKWNQRSGKGTYTWNSGKVYEGDWKFDRISGKGKMKYKNGNVYEGDWEDHKRNGKGKTIYSNGNVYEGNWINDLKEGVGLLTLSNGDRYNLTFKNDKEIGKRIFSFKNKKQLKKAIENWGNNNEQAIERYGDISEWDVSNVTDMSNMFYNASSFNGNISGWNVSNVTDMDAMFSGASSFNSDISGWNVSEVTDMRFMLSYASSFNSDISGWNVSKVTDMTGMFKAASSFNSDISGWDVSKVTNMSLMFSRASNFNQDLSNWVLGSDVKVKDMFLNATEYNNSGKLKLVPGQNLPSQTTWHETLMKRFPSSARNFLLKKINNLLIKSNDMNESDNIISFELLSKGGFGIGYKIQTKENKKFFIKLPIARTKRIFSIFKQEYGTTTKFNNHPNIVRVIGGLGFEYNRVYMYVPGWPPGNEDNAHQTLKDTFIIVTELYDGDILNTPKEWWKNSINLIKFIMAILNGLNELNKQNISHKDLKPTNIAYSVIDGVYYFKIIDLGATIEMKDRFYNTDLFYYYASNKSSNNNFDTITPLIDAPERDGSKIVTEKYDIYSLGVTILMLLNTKSYYKKELYTSILDSIRFIGGTETSNNMLKDLIYFMTQSKYSTRPSITSALKYLVDIIYTLPKDIQADISEYLINNYKKFNYYSEVPRPFENKNFTFLNKMLGLVAHKFRNRDIKEICKIHLERIKKRRIPGDLSDNTLKYLTCNFLGYSDSLVGNTFLDPGHGVAIELVAGNFFIKDILKSISKNKSRECVSIGEEDHVFLEKIFEEVNRKVNREHGGVGDVKKIYLAISLAEKVYQLLTTGDIANIVRETDESLKKLKNTYSDNVIPLSEIIKGGSGVCRHRAITFKYLCDMANIECRLVRGLLYPSEDSRDEDFYPIGITGRYYHAWNVIKIGGVKTLFDIMNPKIEDDGTRNFDNDFLHHKYAIPSLDVNTSLDKSFLKNKRHHYDVDKKYLF